MNVVVVVMDSLRADHVYGRARAHADDGQGRAARALRFTRAYPEGMPTIPARRSIMSGRRTFPFRGWHPVRRPAAAAGLGAGRQRRQDVDRGPARARAGRPATSPTTRTSCCRVHKNFRGRFDRVELVDGQVPLRRKPTRHGVAGRARQRTCRRRCAGRAPSRAWPPTWRPTRATGPRRSSSPPRVFTRRRWAGSSGRAPRQPFALVIDSFDAHEPWDAPRRLSDMYGPPDASGVEPIQPFPTPAAKYARARPVAGRCCGACASSTRPR